MKKKKIETNNQKEKKNTPNVLKLFNKFSINKSLK